MWRCRRRSRQRDNLLFSIKQIFRSEKGGDCLGATQCLSIADQRRVNALLVLITRPPCVRPEHRSLISFCAALSASSCVGAYPQEINWSGFFAPQIIQW